MSFNYKAFTEDIKQYSQELADRILEPDGTHRKSPGSKYAGWICENCGSGSGENGTGITLKEGVFSCWSCSFKGDILNLIGQHYKLTDSMEIAKKAAELAGIDLNRYSDSNYTTQFNTQQKRAEPPQESQEDFIEEAARHIEETDYHRGISLETLKRFKIGYVPNYQHSDKMKPEPALIIPTSKYSYAARYINKDTAEKHKYLKRGTAHLFNSQALYNTDKPVIFIVEGELDALSIIEAGGDAIGLGSTGNYTRLIKEIEQNGKPAVPLVIVADNDKPKEGEEDKPTPGKAGADKLAAELNRLGVPFYYEDIQLYPPEVKDANEALNRNRESFTGLIKAVEQLPAADLEIAKQRYIAEYSTKAATTDFIGRIKTEYTEPIKTGWESMDSILEGGLYPGMYVLGALSSMGKTTYALQMADQIAESGTDVLIISLEQSRDELIAKTLSRYTYQIESNNKKPNYHNAKTVRGILDGSRYIGYNREEHNLIEAALDKYRRTTAPHLFIIEGRGNIGTKEIREAVARHTKLTGKAPVVFIDYLQILKPTDERASDKQNADRAVSDLYRIARDYKTPVITISSFNRESYNRPASMSSFKESGGIEYSADIAIAVQPLGMENSESKTALAKNATKVAEAKKATERELEVKILKNRNGRTEVGYRTVYKTLFNLYEDLGTEEPTEDKPQFKKR